MGTLVMTIAGVLAWTSVALAGTQLEAHQQRLRRYAPPLGSPTQKTFCICRSDTVLFGAVGHVVQTTQIANGATQIHAQCAVPRFDATGRIQAYGGCVTFDTLAK